MIFTMIGLIAVTLLLAWIGLLGVFMLFFNDIGGNGSKGESAAGVMVIGGACWTIYYLWSNFSPISVVAS